MFNTDFKIIYFLAFVLASIIRGSQTKKHKKEATIFRQKFLLDSILIGLNGLAMLIQLIYVFTSWLDFANYSLPVPVAIVGILLFLFYCWLLWRSHKDLGRNWTIFIELREKHTLITDGIYKYIRHPMYGAHLIWAISLPMILHNWIAGFFFILFFIPMYLYRVPREEKMMLEQFGNQYRDYMKKTGRMLPRWKN